MTGLPISWQRRAFADVVDFREGPGILARDFRSSGVPLIRLAGLAGRGSTLRGCDFLDPEMVQRKWAHFAVEPGDTLLSTSASLGRVVRVSPDAKGAIPYTGIIRMRPLSDDLDASFLPFMLESRDFQQQAEAVGAGSVMRHFGPSHLREMTVVVPPRPEQRGIAATLGALDDKIDSNSRLAQLCLDLATTRYRAAIGAGADYVRLADAGSWLSGATPATDEPAYWSGELPWISAATLKDFFIRKSDRRLTAEGQARARVVPRGTLLLVVRGMSLKSELRFGLTQREVAFGQDCKAILDGVVPSVVVACALLANRDAILDLVDEAGHGTGRLQSDRLERFEIAVPRDAYLGDELQLLLNRGAAAAQESDTLGELRDKLLPELLYGRIRVPEAYEAVAATTA